MHLINDENGNVVPHGHEHNHSHEHTHGHTHEHVADFQKGNMRLGLALTLVKEHLKD